MTTEATTAPFRDHPLRDLPSSHLPGDAGYDAARMPWNVAVDQRPAAVVVPSTATEVAAAVRAAASAGLRVAPQGTGHNPGPLGALDDTVLLRTTRLADVVVDPVTRIARVGAGAVWESVVQAAAPHGLTALHGSSPDVGVAGYSLGGGVSWYARQFGLAANSISAIELVTADGSLVRADHEHHTDLFWALRGGSGNFGVVTALEFDLYPIETAYAGMLIWDRADAEPVLRRWATWAADAPDHVTTSFRMLNLPPLPELPEFLRGRQLAAIDGAVLDTDEGAEALLADLRALRPEIDTFGRMPAAGLLRLHMDPEGPTPGVSDTAMLAGLPEAAIDAFLAEVGHGSQTTLLASELRQLGGALGRPHPGGGALDRLDGQFALFGVAIAATPELGAQGHADAVRLTQALESFSNGRHYLNFAENPVDARAGYAEDAWSRLSAIKAAVDPTGLFAANHAITG